MFKIKEKIDNKLLKMDKEGKLISIVIFFFVSSIPLMFISLYFILMMPAAAIFCFYMAYLHTKQNKELF